jgi:surface protein
LRDSHFGRECTPAQKAYLDGVLSGVKPRGAIPGHESIGDLVSKLGADLVHQKYGHVEVWDVRGRLGLSGAFSGRAGITGRLDLSFWDTHHVTTTYAAFSQTSFDVDVSTWDVSNVECMTSMFSYATGFTGDVSEWDVSNVTRMDEMFKGAAIFTGNVGSWEVGGVTNMQMMFMDAASFDCDLSGWNVTGLSSMSRMFSGAAMFNGNVGRWKVGLVTCMSMMFKGAESFDGDISGWDVGLVTDMYMMFKGANSFKADLGGWNVGNVSEMTSMFEGATAFNSDLARWDVSSVIKMRNMFEGATSFTGGGVEKWISPVGVDATAMFEGATKVGDAAREWAEQRAKAGRIRACSRHGKARVCLKTRGPKKGSLYAFPMDELSTL